MTEKILNWFMQVLQGMPNELIVGIVSMVPVVELRGGLIAAALLGMPLWRGVLFCLIGNMIPVPFILLFIRQIFAFMKKHNILTKFIAFLEGKTARNQEKVMRYKQWGLLLFVAVPLPGTGGWTGSLFAALLEIDFKKALPIIALGVFIADIIMSVLTYGAGAVFHF